MLGRLLTQLSQGLCVSVHGCLSLCVLVTDSQPFHDLPASHLMTARMGKVQSPHNPEQDELGIEDTCMDRYNSEQEFEL